MKKGNVTQPPRLRRGLHKSVWENIISSGLIIDNIGVPFRTSFLRDVKSGGETSFWNDIWAECGQTLSSCFPRLYALESNKHCRVNERWGVMHGIWGGNWEWCSSPRGRTLDEVGELSRLIGNLVLSSEQQDGWRWNLNPNGRLEPVCPQKSEYFIWRVVNDRLPTRANLLLRGLSCSVVSHIWSPFWNWWRIDHPPNVAFEIDSE
ncbi:hypothetical protein CTI12_AA304420 [Artemisia annua]|uniref:Reverse transcriptase domain, Reverse transcriptase zinc-binding domain protein n=1 Tax=Artemisia annua TaxID=35608 RepID=A0A2U1LKN8_ARTAN|nr:hypothetical protein CTI12_AA304420 [Artemisia annua]